jgi:hypothetical protein
MRELSSRRRFLRKAAFAGGGALLGTIGLNQISPQIWREPLEFEPNRSYWARSQSPQNPPLTEDIAVDVAVLGGGFTGLSAAYYIRSTSPHKRVVVLPRCSSLTVRRDSDRNRSPSRSALTRLLHHLDQDFPTFCRITHLSRKCDTGATHTILSFQAHMKPEPIDRCHRRFM